MKILQNGADGRIDYLIPDYPLLFDICQKYVNNRTKTIEVEALFNFYLKNRKDAFTDSIRNVYPKQTVGSYLARFSPIELLERIVQEKININSSEEENANSYIFEIAPVEMRKPIRSTFFDNMVVYHDEKKRRMELLLDAGTDVAMTKNDTGATIFHIFSWYPFEEDYTDLLDRMIENGADLFQKDQNGNSCIKYGIQYFALNRNTEAYLEYVISRGLDVTKRDLAEFNSWWFDYMEGDNITRAELARLEKIKTILENNVK